jgi:SOS-response transcriptional repressor LexA
MPEIDFLTKRIPILAPVYAGSPTPPLDGWKIEKFRDIRPIKNCGFNDRLAGLPVIGNSLVDQGIIEGDLLIFKFTSEAKIEKLCIWQTPHGNTAKFARTNADGTVTLHNKNGWQQTWSSDDIRLVGVVVRVERDL